MPPTLSDFWPALCPTLPAAWDTDENRRNLAEVTARMAPIPRVALECALGDAAPALDLQQCVRRDGHEEVVLGDFLLTGHRSGPAVSDPWARLQRFCAAWADPSTSLHAGIGEIFLEYDLPRQAGGTALPSVFFALGEAATALAVRESIADDALRLLLAGSWGAGLREHLARCLRACPQGASVGYLGVMLGRGARGVRVNVKRLPAGELGPYLGAVGWPGPVDAAERWGAWAYDRFDRVTVCLDVGGSVLPHIGLECLLANQPDREPRWGVTLEELVEAGVCRPGNAAALLSVPGALRPPDHQASWPAAWIADALSGSAGRFSTTERRLSHLKLTVSERATVLKGYWGAGHVWRTAQPPGSGEARSRSGRHRETSAAAAERAATAATAFLVGAQAHTGRWSDFLLPAGPSDEWVTAFVGACLAGISSEAAQRAAARAWQALLARRRDEPGWGYNRVTPPDADSTAWALRLGATLGAGGGRVDEARRFLEGHLVPDGGVTTYAAGDPIRRFTRLPEDASIAGWQASHICVTAAAGPVVGASVVPYLARSQSSSGHWTGYWWWDDEYATALAAEVVPGARARAAEWAERRVGASGAVCNELGQPSPWATAWCLRILSIATATGARAAAARAVRFLVGAQGPDGSWPPSARLRVPLPAHLDLGEPGRMISALDHQRVFTTAAVAAALYIARSA